MFSKTIQEKKISIRAIRRLLDGNFPIEISPGSNYYKEDEFCVFLPFRVGLHAFDDVTVGKPFSIVRWKHSLASEQNQPPEEQMRDIFLKYSPSLRVEFVNKVKLRFPQVDISEVKPVCLDDDTERYS